ncbi:hypothetical protein ACI2L1_00060 [Streptomyces sp. NPDC019531]|uniref:hypothetical protein n=1 Tax=Streptomyces sp. NPDC019531 TaxID=3365062 RepID=UPI00384C50BC
MLEAVARQSFRSTCQARSRAAGSSRHVSTRSQGGGLVFNAFKVTEQTADGDFGPTGYPATITDALNKSSSYVYDERGLVRSVTDALGRTSTRTYDTYGRPTAKTVPKNQAAGVYITIPAPEYDANDNVTRATAPNGAVSTAGYDDADQITSATAPKDTSTSDERTSVYTYDKVGNLTTTTEPKGTLTTSDTTDYVTTNHYDPIN